MKDLLHLSIITAEGAAYDRMVGYVNIPTPTGSVGVLSGHAPMLCAVKKGLVRCGFGAGRGQSIHVGSGVANIDSNQVTILVSDASAETEYPSSSPAL